MKLPVLIRSLQSAISTELLAICQVLSISCTFTDAHFMQLHGFVFENKQAPFFRFCDKNANVARPNHTWNQLIDFEFEH